MTRVRIGITDLVSPSYFPALAAEELGLYRAEGLDAHVELVRPVNETYARLAEGTLDFVADGVHDSLPVRPRWEGLQVLMALQQGTPWLLVVRRDLGLRRGDLAALKGLRIAAAFGPDFAFKRLLSEAGLDPARDVELCLLPPAEAAGVSDGVVATRALAAREVDGFWANALRAAVTVSRGVGSVHLDVRRGDEPAAASGYTFAALIARRDLIEHSPELVGATMKAVVGTQKALREDPSRAAEVGRRRFPPEEAALIAGLVTQDGPFYDAAISQQSLAAVMDFAQGVGLLEQPVAYGELVATQFRSLWQ